jgi:acyl-coenzyme A synthetase/AMP-(fatty) acid ligase
MAGRRIAVTTSPSNLWGLTCTLSGLVGGGSVVMLSEENARVLGYIDLYRADAMLTTPALLSRIVNLPGAGQFLTGMRDIRVGGALTARALIAALTEMTPARLHLGYGASEIGMVFGYIHDRDNPRPEGYLGPCINDQVEITLHAEDGTVLPPDATEGTVGFRITDPALRRQYLQPADADGPDITEELSKVFFPGDVLRRDASGYHFVGRTRNLVNFGGDKYSLDLIAAHLCAVFDGRMVVPLVERDAQGIEGLVLVTAGIEPVEAERAQEALVERFGNARVLRCETVHEIPMTDTGKVDTLRLRALMRGH